MSSDPTAEEHLQIAQDIFDFAAWLASHRADPVVMGWAVTNVYYAALHALSGYVLARHGAHVEAHQDRARWFAEYPELRKSEKWDYRVLKTASEEARYKGQPYTAAQYEAHRKRAAQLMMHWSSLARRALGT